MNNAIQFLPIIPARGAQSALDIENHLTAQVEELKPLLLDYNSVNHQSLTALLEDGDDVALLRSRIFPIVPVQQPLTQEQTYSLERVYSRPEAALDFAPTRFLRLNPRNDERSFLLRDAVVKVRFVGTKGEYSFFSSSFDFLYSRIVIGNGGNGCAPQAFLTDVYKDGMVWELAELYILAETYGNQCGLQKSEESSENCGLLISFSKEREFFRLDRLNLGFTLSYVNPMDYGVELHSDSVLIDSMRLERITITAQETLE